MLIIVYIPPICMGHNIKLGKSDTNKQIAVLGSGRSLVTRYAESPTEKGMIANNLRAKSFQFCDFKKLSF